MLALIYCPWAEDPAGVGDTWGCGEGDCRAPAVPGDNADEVSACSCFCFRMALVIWSMAF